MSEYRDDIERYLRGDMTPAEMHALEKKALQDPFLADALEGASGISPAEFSSDIEALKARVSRKTRPSSGVRWYYQAAAAVLLTGVAALMILYLSNRERATTPIALNAPSQSEARQQPPASLDSVLSEQPSADAAREEYDGIPDSPQTAREERFDIPEVATESEIEEVVDKPVIPDLTPEQEDAPLVAQEELNGPPRAQEQKSAPARVGTEAPQAARRSLRASGAVADSRAVEGRVVRGRVTDAEDGMPLPGVNVMVRGTTTGTVTDLNGYYEIGVPDNAEALMFSFVGLNSVETDVPGSSGDSATLDVKMTPDVSSLSEVVVTGYGTEGEYGFEEIKWEPAEPEGGKRAFRRYLETNVRYPRLALEHSIEGKVTVQFTIEPTGDLTEFRVVRSLGYGCDEEVIRLIREGPRWKPTKRNDEPVKGKGKVKLKFELPKDKK